jgi:hypothetical protein
MKRHYFGKRSHEEMVCCEKKVSSASIRKK